MSNDLNRWTGIGRLGRDPETRYTPSGGAVCSFSIACGSRWKDKNSGEQQEKTEWVNITAFGKLGEICEKYLAKGSQIYIEGRLQTDKWQDKEGKDRYTTKVIAERMQMLGGKGEAERENETSEPQTASAAGSGGGGGGAFDDGIPFAQHERGFVA